MTKLALGLSILALVCLLTSSLWGQATAQISGTVRDQTGAVLPGVEVTAAQTGTGIARSTVTNETGSYVFSNLAIGPYRLEASLPGFRTFVQTGIVLQVSSNPVINPVLDVGQVTEQVEVQANAAMVETRSVGVGQVIENERILELPLNGRNVTDLITLAGAAVQQGQSTNRTFGGSGDYRTPIISAAGSVGFGAGYKLDGIAHIDPYDGQSIPLPFPDALQEFKVETSGLSAQENRAAQVNAVTKSGTNEFHGNLFDFVRNDLFNARQYFATKNSTLKRNQFGGTAGGPILQNKLFFFAGVQGTTIRQDPSDIRSYVPTAAMLAGDFTAIASPVCNAGRQITLRAPFVNNRVDPARFSSAALKIASYLPKSSDPCGLITFGRQSKENDVQIVGRGDYQMSPNHSMFGRYVFNNTRISHPYSIDKNNILNTSAAGFNNYAQAYAFGDTYLINPTTVNSFRLSVSRVNAHRLGSEFFEPREVGIDVYSYLPHFMSLSVTGGFSVGGGTQNDSTFITNFYQMADDVSLVRGTHQFAFGGYLSSGRHSTNTPFTSSGNFTFNGQDTGLGLSDFLAGRLSGLEQRAPNVFAISQWTGAMYAQDTWKASPRLTVNYGVRWQPLVPQVIGDSRLYLFDYNKFHNGVKSTVFKNAPPGFTYPGDPGFPGKNTNYFPRWNVFGPRLGLAWDPQGNGSTSVRASFSVSQEDLPLQMRIQTPTAPPWGNVIRLTSFPGGLDNPYRDFPGGNPFPFVVDVNASFIPFGDFMSPPERFKPMSTSSWNLSIQQQIGADWLLSATYLGTHSIHLWNGRNVNPAVYLPGGACTLNGVTYNPCSTTANTNQRRRYTLERPADGLYIANLNQYDTGGTQSYEGLLASIQRRASRGVTVGGNYTWSHCIGDQRRGNSGEGFTATESYGDPNDRHRDRGNCSGDRRHIINATAVAETPQFQNPALRTLATGWRLAGIYRWSTGPFLTVTTGLDRALTGITGDAQRPDLVLLNVYGDKTLKNYLNPAAFTQPALGTLGNLGVGTIQGPGRWQLDAALSRIFRFRESQRLEFRAEAYNLTNSLRMGNPGTNFNSLVTFGQINTAEDPRILQFALKYVF